MTKNKLGRVVEHKASGSSTEHDGKIRGAEGSRLRSGLGFLAGLIKMQWPVLLAIIIIEIVGRTEGYDPSAYSIVAPVFLSVVIYVALRHGMRQGLVAAAIVLVYNTYSLVGAVDVLAFSDRNVRRIVLLAVVLPVLAYIVGRLAERNNYLLQHEKQARKNAEDSERRVRFMAESMPQKIFTCNPQGQTEYLNLQWSEYTGLSPELVAAEDWTNLVHPDEVADNVAQWEYSLRTGEPFAYEHRLRRHDGEYRWHVSRAHAQRNQDGTIQMWVGSSTDIHDIRSALEREHKLERTTARLTEQKEQLLELNSAKDEFISLASHQLRTPATGVKQYVGMVLEGYAGDITDSQQAFLKQAYESNERQITIVNDLLKVAKVDAGKVVLRKEKTNMVELLKSIIDEQSAKFALRRQKVVFNPKQARLFATVDQGHIRMVLENIIDNASKYTPQDKMISVSISKSKGQLRIAVKDQGVGIDQKDVDKAFDKFARIDNPLSVQVGGSGLGLYWAKKVVDLHGGTIAIESTLGEGSIFTVSLPG